MATGYSPDNMREPESEMAVVEPPPIPEPIIRLSEPVTNIIARKVVALVETHVTARDSIFSREKKENLTPEQLVLYPFSPQGPTYSLHQRTGSNNGLEAKPLHEEVGVVAGDLGNLPQRFLVPFPRNTDEAIQISVGGQNLFAVQVQKRGKENVVAVTDNNGNPLSGEAELGQGKVLTAGYRIDTKTATTQTKETTYFDGQPTQREEIVLEQKDIQGAVQHGCTMTPVTTVDGRQYIFIETLLPQGQLAVVYSPALNARVLGETHVQTEVQGGTETVGYATKSNDKHPQSNEDAVSYHEASGTMILADGMGGQGGASADGTGDGYRVSRIAIAVVQSVLDRLPKNASAQMTVQAFEQAIRLADAQIRINCPAKKRDIRGRGQVISQGGTTLTLLRRVGDELVYAKVGDNKTEVVRDGEIIFSLEQDNTIGAWEQMAKAHEGKLSLPVNERFKRFLQKQYNNSLSEFQIACQRNGYRPEIQNGSIVLYVPEFKFAALRFGLRNVDVALLQQDPLGAYAYALRNEITASLGGNGKLPDKLDIGIAPVKLQKGDIATLESDGISDPLTDEHEMRVYKALAGKPAPEIASALVHLAQAVSTNWASGGGMGEFVQTYRSLLSLPGEENRTKPHDDRTALVAYL